MIIREIKEKPEEVIKRFDWFNDYKDTREWAKKACPDVVPLLDDGHENWMESQKNINGKG